MVKLVQELESQQLANMILKSKIASLQANTIQKIKSLSNSPILFKANGVSPVTSAANTPSPITTANNESNKLNSIFNLNQFQSDEHGSPGSNKSPDDDNNNHNNNTKEDNRDDNTNENGDNNNLDDLIDDEQNSDDEMNNDESNDNETNLQTKFGMKSTSAAQELDGGSYQSFFKTKHKQDSSSLNKSKLTDLNDSTQQSKTRSSSSTSNPKTPKSALLERRRKAVFELLIQDTYPSGRFFFLKFF